ncbi:MAG: hypothetical protein RLY40_622 [Pseudomonadota bacterium]|jgi:hypothetical protein
MKRPNYSPEEPTFSGWPITKSLKILLLNETKWKEYFLIESNGLAMIFDTLSDQIKSVNFFGTPSETSLFFRFLKEFIASKPQSERVLKAFSQITAEILDKLSLETHFNSAQECVAIHYLKLLAFMLEPNYSYLFEIAEISIWTNDFQKISNKPFKSLEFLSEFRKTLLLSYQSRPFIKNYPALIQTNRELAYAANKSQNNAELMVMKLLDSLGVLDHTLKTSPIYQVKQSQTGIHQSIQITLNLIYDQFQPYVEANLLRFSVYKNFVKQSYPLADNQAEICDIINKQTPCKSNYLRFKDSYPCPSGQLTKFSIEIKNNNLTKYDLDKLCLAMRGAEGFLSWMTTFGVKPNYNASRYDLHLSDSKINFLIDKFLFERDDPPPDASYTIWATYFPSENNQTDFLKGSTYAHTTNLIEIIHEYIHHLYALYIPDLKLDLTLTEGIAELYSGGICPERNIHNLRNFVNDTFIFEFFKARKYPFYFNSLKWVAYLVNEQPEFFKRLIGFLQKNDTDGFYASLDAFIDSDHNRQEFVTWSQQQVNICNTYLSRFPHGHQPPVIYLRTISDYLNQTQNLSEPEVILTKRDVSFQARELDLYEVIEHSYLSSDTQDWSKEFWQGMETGIPLHLAALFAGMTSSILDEVGLNYKDNYPSLPAYLNNGFKPFIFAAASAGLNTIFFDQAVVEVEEKFARLFAYFIMNFLTVVIAQPLNKRLAESIQNKALSFFVQMMTWTMLWNPSLFLSESSRLFSTLFLQVTQALCFKVGEESYQIGKRICSPFWHRNKPQTFDIEEAFIESDNDEKSFENKVSFRHS